jgi:hypothetical protein
VTTIELLLLLKLLDESKKQKENEPRWAGLTEKYVEDPGLLAVDIY